MKTLYININNEQIQSNDELEVLNYDLDSDFFFYLGEKIAKNCKVENENALITDFNTLDNAEDYQKIIAQWNELKNILFNEGCEGKFEFTLPNGYIHWLRYSEKYNHVHDINFSHSESPVISIDLEELYEESVVDMQRKVLRMLKRNDLYLGVDEIVFNDDAVTRKSSIIRTIKDKYEGVGFKTYKKWLQDNDEKLHTTPQISEKCEKNPCECYFDEQCCYAVAVNLNKEPSWSSVERKYKFYNHNGQPLDDNEYYIVAEGRDDNYGSQCKTNLLVVKTENDPTLYFISADGTFHKIGEYDYEQGYSQTNNGKDYYKYNAHIIEDKYILYKKNREYQLFEIKSNRSIKKIANFSSKIQIYANHIIKNYIVCLEFTIDYHTGEIVKINGCKGGLLIGFYNNESFFLMHKDWEDEDAYLNSSIVNSRGKVIKRKFGYDGYKYLSEALLIVELWNENNRSYRYGIINIIGDVLLPCVYEEIKKVSDNIYKLVTEDYDESYYIVSKNKIVDGYNEDYYVIIAENGKYKIYDLDSDELINQITINDDEIGIIGDVKNKHFISNLYVTEGDGNGEIRSIIDNNVVYDFPPGNEELVGVNKNGFIVKGDSYIEIYDHNGTMLKCIDIDMEYMSNFVLYPNGYISFWNSRLRTTGWLDNEYTIHHASDYVKSDTYLNIEKFTSNNSVILRSKYETFVVCNGNCVYRGYKLDKIDYNNFYGADYEFEDRENNWCIVNMKNGTIPVHGKCREVYLIK